MINMTRTEAQEAYLKALKLGKAKSKERASRGWNPNPEVLTEIAGTMFYALCLYRAKPSATRVIVARFLICFVVNVVLQQVIFAWQYTYMGNPEKAKDSIMGIMTTARIFKNLFFFPIESVVITLFLKVLIPITSRAKLTYGGSKGLDFTKKQIAALVLLVFDIVYLVSHGRGTALLFLLIVAVFIVLGMLAHLFPLIARFDMKPSALLRTAFSLVMLHLPATFAVIAMTFLPLFLLAFHPSLFLRFGVAWAGIWFALIAYFFGRLLLKIWDRHLPSGG